MCFKLYRVFSFSLLSSYHTTNEVMSCCACYRMVDMYLYNCGESFTHSYCNKSDQFLMRAGLHQGCFLSPIRYITFMHRDFRLSQAVKISGLVASGSSLCFWWCGSCGFISRCPPAHCGVVCRQARSSMNESSQGMLLSWKKMEGPSGSSMAMR